MRYGLHLMTPQDLERQLRQGGWDPSLANRLARTSEAQQRAQGPTGRRMLRPAGAVNGGVFIPSDQCGYINSADATRFATTTDEIWIKSHGDTGQEVQTLVRFASPISRLQGVVLTISAGRVTTTAAAVLENVTCNIEGITTDPLDLSTINWNNRATLTYTSGIFRVSTWKLNPLSAGGPASFTLHEAGAQQEISCWAAVNAAAGGLSGVGLPGYPNPLTGLRIRFGTLAVTNLIYELLGAAPVVGKLVRAIPVPIT